LARPKITIRLESSVIDFTTLMKSLEQDAQKTAKKDQQKRRFLSDDPLSFNVLKKVDADIVLKARKIQAKDAHLKLGHLTLKLEDSNFKIDKIEASYKQTKISGKLHINHGSPSQIATNFLVQYFDLGSFHKGLRPSVVLWSVRSGYWHRLPVWVRSARTPAILKVSDNWGYKALTLNSRSD